MSELTRYMVDPYGVALLQLDRPKSRNAINTPMLEELLAHLATAREDESVRVLVISSTDHMGLSAGADVKEDLDKAGAVRKMELFAQLYDEVVAFPNPTIAACHGACVGGGAEIAIACDLRVGGSNMRLRFPGAALGVPVGPARLVTLCGLSVAKYCLLTSKEINADLALRWGLIHKVAPAPSTEEHSLILASHMATMPPESLTRMKSMLHAWDDVVGRSEQEGAGQVAWQTDGPGLGYTD